jgi:hypothetical protein
MVSQTRRRPNIDNAGAYLVSAWPLIQLVGTISACANFTVALILPYGKILSSRDGNNGGGIPAN